MSWGAVSKQDAIPASGLPGNQKRNKMENGPCALEAPIQKRTPFLANYNPFHQEPPTPDPLDSLPHFAEHEVAAATARSTRGAAK